MKSIIIPGKLFVKLFLKSFITENDFILRYSEDSILLLSLLNLFKLT